MNLPAENPPSEILAQKPIDTVSLLTLVPDAVAARIQAAVESHPGLFNIDERELYKLAMENIRQGPSPTDNRIRLKFWMEYDRATANGEKAMKPVNFLSGICTKQYFYENYLKNPYKVAWLVCPPVSYLEKTQEALAFGLDQLRDILEMPHQAGGKIDTKLGNLKAKIVEMLDARVQGAVIQRSMNVTMTASNKSDLKAFSSATSMDELKQELHELRRRERESRNLPVTSEIKDIEVE